MRHEQSREIIEASLPFQVKCEKLVIENDDVAKGIAEIVSLHGVSKLIMGAAADKHFSRYAAKVHTSALISIAYNLIG